MKKRLALFLSMFMLFLAIISLEAFASQTFTVYKEIAGYGDSISAANGTNSTVTYPSGTYSVYKIAPNGMYNISRSETSPGVWINPAKNIPADPVENPGPQEPQKPTHLTKSNVNFRSGPSTSYPVVQYLVKGTKVTLIAEHSSTWVKASVNGMEGYISASYLQLIGTAPQAPEKPSVTPYMTTASVNFRSGPSTSNISYGILPHGTEISYLSASNGWANVIYNGKTGYISTAYIVSKSAYTPPAPAPVTTIVKIGLTWNGNTSSSLYTHTAHAVKKAGGQVVNLPKVSSLSAANTALAKVDGVIFIGGSDIGAKYYGASTTSHMEYVNIGRDTSDYYMMKAAYANNMPTLGQCRGMQWINVIAGGTLYQDVRAQFGTDVRHRSASNSSWVYHNIAVSSGNILSDAIGSGTFSVNSWHHQGVHSLGSNLKVIARGADGLPEAIQATNKTFFLGTQFHPETHVYNGSTVHLKIYKAFLSAARNY